MSLVFYDTETTGAETFFDQILQFAAIKTDVELKELDRFETRCRLLPHVVPSPGAMKTTGITVSQLTDPTLPSHYDMVRSIFAKLDSWSPALFIGWNSLEFDEDLIRQALYKTLHNPYLTNRPGNSRSDVMRMVQACSLFAPDALVFPTDDNGKKIFRLDQVAPANGCNDHFAHDAMGDVLATIFVCRLVMERAPNVWSAFMRFSTKAAVSDYIQEERLLCLSEFYFGKPHSCIGTVIGKNSEYDSEWYIFNLGIDPDSLSTFTDAELSARLRLSPKPIRKLKTNGAPMIFPIEDAPAICQGRECDQNELERRADIVRSDPVQQRLLKAVESQKIEYPPSPHIERQIYGKFFERSDQILMDQFHKTDWSGRHAIVEQFQDPRLRMIGKQLIHLEQPQILDKAVCLDHEKEIVKRLLGHGEDIPWLTLPEALVEIQEMLQAATGAELKRLREHEQYLKLRHKQALKMQIAATS